MKSKTFWGNWGVFLLLFSTLSSQNQEIIPLTDSIGFNLDAAENKYYGVFKDIPGFESAQFYEINRNRIEARITYLEYSRKKVSRRAMSLREFTNLQFRVKQMPIMTLKDRDEMADDFTYLRTDEILSSIPKDQFVKIKHRSGKRLSGTLVAYLNQNLIIQTPLSLEKVKISNLERVTYREKIISRPEWKLRIYGMTALLGLFIMESWNNQTNPRTEIQWHNRFIGAAVGTLAGAELFDTFEILASPKTHFGLTPSELDALKNNKLRSLYGRD